MEKQTLNPFTFGNSDRTNGEIQILKARVTNLITAVRVQTDLLPPHEVKGDRLITSAVMNRVLPSLTLSTGSNTERTKNYCPQGPTRITNGIHRTFGLPKGYYDQPVRLVSHGNGASILVRSRLRGHMEGSRISLLSIPTHHYCTHARGANMPLQARLDALKTDKNNGTNEKTNKLIHLIADPDFLRYHYETKGRNPGYMTPATDTQTVDGIDNK